MNVPSTPTGKIPLLDVNAQNHPLTDELRDAFERVLKSGQFIMGPEIGAFEREVADYLGVRHAIGVSSGTDALLVALMALGVGKGDQVVTTPYSFFATAGGIRRVGATPVFVDIDVATYNIDATQIEAKITDKTKAIMPVHLFGQAANMKAIRRVAAAHSIPIIEDAAQAIGARTSDGPVGGLGAFGCFSLFPSKNLGALGDGGLVTTNDDSLAETARILRVHGAKPKYHHVRIGGNFRLDALQAAFLRVKLHHLEGWAKARKENAAAYDKAFSQPGMESLVPPLREHDGLGGRGHIFNQYVIRTPHREPLQQALADSGIGTAVYYPTPLHLQPCFHDLGHVSGDFPEAERASKETLALPVFAELSDAQLSAVVRRVEEFFCDS